MARMLAERLARSRRRAGLKQVELAVALGDRYNQQMVSMVESGQRQLRLPGLAAAARELSVSTDYLLGLTDNPTPSVQLDTELTDARARLSELDDAAALAAPAEEGQHVDVLEVAPAAGSGAVIEGERVTGRIKCRRTWLRRHGLVADNCRVLTVAGESMEPTLPDGCSMLVNRAQRRLRDGRIFVVRTADGLIVKRAVGEGGGWVLTSDNPSGEWPPVPWPDDAEVVGEVRWAARTFA